MNAPRSHAETLRHYEAVLKQAREATESASGILADIEDSIDTVRAEAHDLRQQLKVQKSRCATLEDAYVGLRGNTSLVALRYGWLEALAHQETAHDVLGNGGRWSIVFFSEDSNLSFVQAMDREIQKGTKP